LSNGGFFILFTFVLNLSVTSIATNKNGRLSEESHPRALKNQLILLIPSTNNFIADAMNATFVEVGIQRIAVKQP